MSNESKNFKYIKLDNKSKGEQLYNNFPDMRFDNKVISDWYSIVQLLNYKFVRNIQVKHVKPNKIEEDFCLNVQWC